MKIYDLSSGCDKELEQVSISLTKDEMKELRDTINLLLDDPDPFRHEHVSNESFDKELTISHEEFRQRTK